MKLSEKLAALEEEESREAAEAAPPPPPAAGVQKRTRATGRAETTSTLGRHQEEGARARARRGRARGCRA